MGCRLDGDEDWQHFRSVNNIFLRPADSGMLTPDTFTYYGATASSYFSCYDVFAYLNGTPFTFTNSAFPEVSGEMRSVTQYGFFLPDAISGFTDNSYYEWKSDSWIGGNVRIKCELVSSFLYTELSGNDFPPVGYGWKAELEAVPFNAFVYDKEQKQKAVYGGFSNWLYNGALNTYFMPLADFYVYNGKSFFEACKDYQEDLSLMTEEERKAARLHYFPISKSYKCDVEIRNYGVMPQLMLAYRESILRDINNTNNGLGG